jgi:hypothetical protein
MSTVLFSGLQATLAGIQAQNVLLVPPEAKQASIAQAIRVSMDATVFPLGTTILAVGISTNNQASFRTASMSCIGGIVPRSNKWTMTYALGQDDVPTHTKITIDAPLGFTSSMTVEAL